MVIFSWKKKKNRNITLWLCMGNKLEQARLEKGSPMREEAERLKVRSGRGQTGRESNRTI